MHLSVQWVAYQTLVKKEVVRFMRIWRQTLLPPVITQSLYFVIFGGFIGSQVKHIDGISYMSFIVPGLVMMAIINGAFTNVSSSFYSTKFQRNIEELLVAPVHEITMLAGYVTGGVIRGLLTGVIVLAVAACFTPLSVSSLFSIVLFSCLTAIVFSLAGMLNGLWADSFDDVSGFATFVLTPLTYLGGVFYPMSSLPPTWRFVSSLNPIVYMMEGFRFGFFGSDGQNVAIGAGILSLLVVALTVMLYVLLRRGKGLRN